MGLNFTYQKLYFFKNQFMSLNIYTNLSANKIKIIKLKKSKKNKFH